MATRKKDQDQKFSRVELDAAIDESLGDDDVWNDIVSENKVPPMVVKGIRLEQPTKEQVDFWRECPDAVKGEKVLLGEEKYAQLHELFNPLPQSAWSNFLNRFLIHMFGVASGEDLGN